MVVKYSYDILNRVLEEYNRNTQKLNLMPSSEIKHKALRKRAYKKDEKKKNGELYFLIRKMDAY
jgi:hypothetical protein